MSGMSVRRGVALLVFAAAVPAVVACDSQGGAYTQPPTGASSMAITNGDLSTESSVVELSIPLLGGGFGHCSGTLVTPSFVLTAAHCVNGATDFPAGSSSGWDEVNPIIVGNVAGQVIGQHTGIWTRDPVARYTSEAPMHFSSPSVWKNDFALIPLDNIVPPNSAIPAKLPFSVQGILDGCAQSFEGYYVGFSDNFAQSGTDHVSWSPLNPFGDTYVNNFDALSFLFTEVPPTNLALSYLGLENQILEHGDSGGPLFRPDHGFKLCGVNSGTAVTTDCDLLLFCTIDGANLHAKLDRVDVMNWFLSKTVDSTGARFKGTCDYGPGATQLSDFDGDTIPDGCDVCPRLADAKYDLTATPDMDEDGVPDRCDNCPTIWNPPLRIESGGLWTQFELTAGDADGDGIGDACDWCPTQPSSNQVAQNCNYETELALFYPGASSPPVIKASTPNRDAELAKYHQAFRSGACEEAPCPAITLSEQAAGYVGNLPAGMQPTGVCVNPVTGKPCTWAARNLITHDPIPSPLTEGLTGNVHTKWCNCNLPESRATLDGRRACRENPAFQCEALNAQFGSARWLDTRTTDLANTTWNPTVSPIVAAETAAYAFEGPTVRRRRWDYTTLPFLTYNGTLPKVDGVLWNSVRTFPAYAFANPALDDRLRERGNSLESGDGRVSKLGGGSGFPVPSGNGGLDDECWPCGFGISTLLIDPTNIVQPTAGVKVLKPTPTGSVEAALSTEMLQLLIDSVTGSRTLVPASEPAGWVESRVPGTPELRGIGLEAGTAKPVRLVVAGFGGTAQAVPVSRFDASETEALVMGAMGVGAGALAADSPAPPAIGDPEGLALSASRKELWLFGGLVAGVPASDAWRFDVSASVWDRVPLRATGRVGDVLAGTYEPVSDVLYALHRDGTAIRLSALRRGAHAFEPVVSLPSPWKAFDSYWLRPDGSTLILAASRKGSARIARLEATGAAVGAVLPHGIVGRPLVTAKGVAYVPSGTADSDPNVELIPPESFKPLPSGWAPNP